MILSVIIPTHNRCSLLQAALNSLEMQTLPRSDFEVLVIDNGSTDNTKQVVESAQQRLGNVRYFYEPTPGLHVGRHLGLKKAKSDILVYADDDIEAFPTWLEAIAESFQDPEVVLVGGKNLPKWESDPPDWILKMWEPDKNGNRILGYLSILDLGDEEKEISPYYVFGCNFSVRKSVLLEAGGFHPDAFPQELIKYRGDGEGHVWQYISERAYKAFYHPKASVYHAVPFSRHTEEYFFRRVINQGISDSFSMIRRRHIVQVQEGNKNRWRLAFSRELIPVELKNRIRSLIMILLFSVTESRQVVKRKILFDLYWLKGFLYHRQQVRKDIELFSYVTKNNFLD